MWPWRSRGELVISMTLAETFLLLVFMIWYSVRPKVPVDPPAPIEVLEKENHDLKERITRLEVELSDIHERLEIWRKVFDLPMPGAGGSAQDLSTLLPTTPERWKQLIFEAGRGKPKCQDDNLLVEATVVDGTAAVNILADCPTLRTELLAQHIDIHTGTILTRAAEIVALLSAVRTFRKGPGKEGDCRFDYRLNYATPEDYYIGRERFEKFFYPAGQQRVRPSSK